MPSSLLPVKGLCSKVYWDFGSKCQRIWHVFFLSKNDKSWSFQNTFSQRYINNSEEPPKNSWSVSFPLRKILEISLMPRNLGKSMKSQTNALFCFIEGIPTIMKFRPSIWSNLTCRNFIIVGIPSIKQNNAFVWLFIDFPKFRGISEISKIFLKGNETLQLFLGGSSELLIYRWENVFWKLQLLSFFERKKTCHIRWHFDPKSQ
jgi:hypothetical protein